MEQKNKTQYSPELPDSPDKWPDPIPWDQIEYAPSIGEADMPKKMFDILDAISRNCQVPLDLPFAIALPVISTAIRNKAILSLPNHDEVPAIWTCVFMPPGSRKSPPFRMLLKPIIEAEKEAKKIWKEKHQHWELKRGQILEQESKVKKKIPQKKDNVYYVEFQNLADMKDDLGDEPVSPHYWTEDATPQSLSKLICENKSLGLFSAEGASIFDGLGQYSKSKGADIRIWLAGHAGDPIKITRASGIEYSCEQAILSVALTAQPVALVPLLKDKLYGGRGFLARFAFFLPPDPRGNQRYELNNKLADEVLSDWGNLIKRIFDINESQQQKICLSSDAVPRWLDFGNEIQDRLSKDGDLRTNAEWASKLPGLCGRIALAYHFIECDDPLSNQISLEILEKAISTCDTLVGHLRSLERAEMLDPNRERAELILDQILNKSLNKITASQISKNGWGGCQHVSQVREVMKILIEYNYVRHDNPQKPTLYFVNPKILSGKSGKSGHLGSEDSK